MTDEGREAMKDRRRDAISSKHEGGIDLEGVVELWATPSSHERIHDTRDVDHGIQLANQAVEELWQTPQVDSFRSRGGDRKDEMGLDQQARLQWVTPASRDYKGANSELHVTETGGGQKAHGPTKQSGRALFPPGPADRERWAEIIAERPDLAPAVEYEVRDVAARLAAGMDFARADQLRGLGNMVVPQQGALAFLVLLERACR